MWLLLLLRLFYFSFFFLHFNSFSLCYSLARNVFLLTCWLHFWCERRRIVRRTYSMCSTHIEWLAHRMSRRECVCVCMRLWPCYSTTYSRHQSLPANNDTPNTVLYINLSKKWLSIRVVVLSFNFLFITLLRFQNDFFFPLNRRKKNQFAHKEIVVEPFRKNRRCLIYLCVLFFLFAHDSANNLNECIQWSSIISHLLAYYSN